ncbi:MAG: TlpA disulfide reductase family protein [Bacteroidota bacterium]
MLIRNWFIYGFISCFCFINCSFQVAPTPSLAIGSAAPDFTTKLDNNKSFTLSSLKGSITLLEFWASWDIPSRKNHLELISIYNKYKDKKFAAAKKFHVVSISIDQKPEVYKVAIVREALPWSYHTCDFNGWYGTVVNLYKVEHIPNNFLLDAQGNIIAKNIFYGDVEVQLQKLLAVKP